MFDIQTTTFAPQARLRTMAPFGSLATPAPVAQPNTGMMIAGGVMNGVMQGFSTYNGITGQTAGKTFKQIGNGLSSMFSIGTPASPSGS